MKATILHAAKERLSIEGVTITKPKRREVVVRPRFSGLCHSDLYFMDGLYARPVPAILGHEIAGVVEMVGEDVTYLKPGDHVIGCLFVFCGACSQCLTGHPNLCSDIQSV